MTDKTVEDDEHEIYAQLMDEVDLGFDAEDERESSRKLDPTRFRLQHNRTGLASVRHARRVV